MSPLRFSANMSMMFQEYEPLERMEAAARAGFEAVEFLFPYEHSLAEIQSRLDGAGIALNHLNTRPARQLGLRRSRVRRCFARVFDQALEYASRLGALTMHCMSGVVAPDMRTRARIRFCAIWMRLAQGGRNRRYALRRTHQQI